MNYPQHYHATCAALVKGDVKEARVKLAFSIRAYRRAGERHQARDILAHANWVGFPCRRRPNGHYN